MGDRGTIFVKYDIIDMHWTDNPEHYRGIIGNLYRGFDPYIMVAGGMSGVIYFSEYARNVGFIHAPAERNDTYQTFRRMFDINFFLWSLHVSEDIADMTKDAFLSGKVPIEKLNDHFFWWDTDFGELIIDIKGNTEDDIKIKYAYLETVNNERVILDIDGYIEKRLGRGDEEFTTRLKPMLPEFREKTQLMTAEEVDAYFDEGIYPYLFYAEMKQYRKEKEGKEIDPDDIDLMGFSIRTYNCLKRAGVHTISQLRKYSETDLKGIRNLSEKCVNEIREKLKATEIRDE